MSESAPEPTGDTGAVGGAGAGASAEDQEGQDLLDGIMAEDDPEELKKQIQHWRSTAQRHERTARTNSSAAKKLADLEDANKSELQKAVDAKAAAELERDAERARVARMTAAVAHELDPDLIDFLGEGTAEEIDARAVQLAGIIDKSVKKLLEQTDKQNGGQRTSASARSGRPVQSMRPGAAPSGSGPLSNDEAFRDLLNRNAH